MVIVKGIFTYFIHVNYSEKTTLLRLVV